MWPNPQFPADLFTFTEEILNGKLHFLCSDISGLRISRFCSREWNELGSYLWPLLLLRKTIFTLYHMYFFFVGFLVEDLIERAGFSLPSKRRLVFFVVSWWKLVQIFLHVNKLRENCPNTELFLVHIFPYLD